MNAISVRFKKTEVALNIQDDSRRQDFEKHEMEADRRFYVRAQSVSAVRRALDRAPGGAKVVGRHDRETILCTHTMAEHSLGRHWPVIVSRLEKAGLRIEKAAGSGSAAGTKPAPAD